MGVSAGGLACLGGGILFGVVVPSSVPDTEMSSFATRVFAVVVTVGTLAILATFTHVYV
jgi:hypothetical protein